RRRSGNLDGAPPFWSHEHTIARKREPRDGVRELFERLKQALPLQIDDEEFAHVDCDTRAVYLNDSEYPVSAVLVVCARQQDSRNLPTIKRSSDEINGAVGVFRARLKAPADDFIIEEAATIDASQEDRMRLTGKPHPRQCKPRQIRDATLAILDKGQD